MYVSKLQPKNSMDKTRSCGCKGCRTCLICENEYGSVAKTFEIGNKDAAYVYCPYCNKAWKGWNKNSFKEHPTHSGEPVDFPGVYIQLDFLAPEEEESFMTSIDEMPWDVSQSGRRKQHFGPKTNFKKKKLNVGNFEGFPAFSEFIQKRFNSVPLLKHYETIEQCSLEYDPIRGASIDPHIDDCWIWGERIVTVNCLSDSVLTMTPYKGDLKKYNLINATEYLPVVPEKDEVQVPNGIVTNIANLDLNTQVPAIVVRIPMPRRSLIILYGESRYRWEHCILREDITERRVCIAYREFPPPYLAGGQHQDEGDVVREKSKIFWDHKVTLNKLCSC